MNCFNLGILFASIFFLILFDSNYLNNIFKKFTINNSFYYGSRHIHHWFIFLMLSLCMFLPYKLLFPSSQWINGALGFSLVMIVDGLLYDDCFVF